MMECLSNCADFVREYDTWKKIDDDSSEAEIQSLIDEGKKIISRLEQSKNSARQNCHRQYRKIVELTSDASTGVQG